MAPAKFASVEDYLAAQPAPARAVLEKVRGAIRRALPKAEETISYNIAAYRLAGRTVIYFAGWKKHYSLYPATAAVREALGSELEPYEIEKGTIRFPLDGPVPARLIARVARVRAAEAPKKR